MKNEGFTLIELLAVIVILAIIALIATPIVINMIGSAKDSSDERSAELYLQAVEQAVARKNLTEKFSPSTCTIQSDGNLKCDGDTLLEIQVENTRPTSGTITFEKGKIIGYNFTLGSKGNVKLVPTAESCFETEDVEGGVTITKYNCGKGTENEILDVVIPNTINGKTVVAIGRQAFYSKELKSVIIPDGVTIISTGAFANNELTSIKIPSNVTSIGNGAFSSNKLKTLEIPTSVTFIAEGAFNNNQLSDAEAFIYKRNSDGSIDNTELVSYGGKKRDNVVIPNNVKIIGAGAFQFNQLTSIKIPSNVTSIGSAAFSSNQLTSVEIPSSVTSIGNMAFSRNQLKSVTIKGKTSTSDFASFGTNVFGWASGYSDSNITFES